jgi:hypothetical protein
MKVYSFAYLYLFVFFCQSFFSQINSSKGSVKKESVAELVKKLSNNTGAGDYPTVYLNNETEGYKCFKLLALNATTNEIVKLVKEHPNGAVKAYSYLILLMRDYEGANSLYQLNYKPINVHVNDVIRLFRKDQFVECKNFLYPRRNRYKYTIMSGKSYPK